jgi:ubiquinone/menaquinone biosynthesis C-methylase UbiE
MGRARKRIGELAMTTLENYPLGYSEAEAKRLMEQGAMLEDLTRDLLSRAGLAPGMRVLDVGCGVGDVSLLAARIVGEKGSVLGVDRSAPSLEIARGRAKRRAELCETANISFVEADLNTFEPDGTFDAIIGRLVLLYVPERASMLRRLTQSLRPGGVMAMQEYDTSSMAQAPESPLFAQVRRWILDGFKSAGAELDTGSKLYATFLQAGLLGPQMVSAQLVHCGPEATGYEHATQVLRSLLPTVERSRVAAATEIEIDTLANRLRDDAVARRAVMFAPRLVSAWARAMPPLCYKRNPFSDN